MKISGLVKNSTVDFPGLLSCVLFVPGCNYNCFYCHNRELIEGAEDIVDPDYIEDFLQKRAGFLDGVVVSGGEPTLRPGLIPYMERIKSLGYKVKLDTNGALPHIISNVFKSGVCDYYAVDYKAPAAEYAKVCGQGISAEPVLETINFLLENGADFEVRTTVLPQFRAEDIRLMAKELPPLPRYVLNRYRVPETYRPCDEKRIRERPHSPGEIKELAKSIEDIQPNVRTG